MNAHTTLTPEGNIPIPADVCARMGLTPGMDIEIDEVGAAIRFRPKAEVFAPDRPRVTTEQLLAKPRFQRPPATIEEISALSNETILRMLLIQEEERNAGD